MPNDRVKVPRFFINYIEYFNRIGIQDPQTISINLPSDFAGQGQHLASVNLNRHTEFNTLELWNNMYDEEHENFENDEYRAIQFKTGYRNMDEVRFNFSAILKHNARSAGAYMYSEMYNWPNDDNNPNYDPMLNPVNYVNYDIESPQNLPLKNGYSIWTHSEGTAWNTRFQSAKFTFNWKYLVGNEGVFTGNYWPTENLKLSGLMMGRYIDLKAPMMSLTRSKDYSTTTSKESLTGKTYICDNKTNISFADSWQLYDTDLSVTNNNKNHRTGKRAWDLGFKRFEESSLFHKFANMQDYDNTIDNTNSTSGFLIENSFYSEVIHKTMGGSIPFIFQPDKDDKTNFALCKLDMDNFSFRRVNKDFYDFELRIVEI